MPMDTRGRSTKQGSRLPSWPHRVETTNNRKGIKVTPDTSYPIAAANIKVTNRSLAAISPEYSVPAVTIIGIPGWALILTSQQ